VVAESGTPEEGETHEERDQDFELRGEGRVQREVKDERVH
jgi:hypothetical protein